MLHVLLRTALSAKICCVLFLSAAILLSGPAGNGSAKAQTLDPPAAGTAVGSELEQLAETVKNFFEQISNPTEGTKSGLETLLKNSSFDPKARDEMINTLSEKIDGIPEQFGEYISFEPIGVKRIGRDLIVLRYLYKCQNYPLIWYFIFYRPTSSDTETAGKTWQIIHLYYDSQLNIPIWETGF